MSWECHRCHAVNAPHVDQCSCNRWAGIGEAQPAQGTTCSGAWSTVPVVTTATVGYPFVYDGITLAGPKNP